MMSMPAKRVKGRRGIDMTKLLMVVIMLSVISLAGWVLAPQNVEATVAITTCDGCHGNPPVDNTTRDGATGQFRGSHNVHAGYSTVAGQYAYSCAVCHVNPNWNTINHRTGNINMRSPLNGLWGTYSKGTSFAQVNNPVMGNCNGVYCHSNAQGPTGTGTVTYASPLWTTVLNCGGCHQDMAGASGTGSHVKHVLPANANYNCNICHGSGYWRTGNNAVGTHVNQNINLNFTATTWSSTTLYTKTNLFAANSAIYGSCTGYCHGTTAASPAWGSTTTCNSCHTSTNAGLSTRHTQHYNSTTAPTVLAGGADGHTATEYVYACLKCHPTNSHATGPYSAAQAAWVTGTKMSSYTPSATSAADSKGYNYTVYGTCATVCHTKDGATAGTAIVPNPSWGTLNGLGCGYCHSAQGVASPTWTTPHSKHVNTYTQFTCNYCHNSTATNNTTIAGAAGRNQHPDSTKQVSFNAWTSGAGAVWSGTQCSNTYCHSQGTAQVGTHAAINWSGAVTCAGCHGNNGAGWTSILTGSHGQHIAQGYTCNACHNATASNNSTIISISNHVDKNVQINFWGSVAPAGATYNGAAAGGASVSTKAVGSAYSSCSTTFCHGSNSAPWGSNTNTAQCTKCHGVAGTTPAQYTAQPNTAAPGWATIGVNTSGQTGTLINNVSNDSKVGAHYGHLANRNGYSTFGQVVCNDCHIVPATVNAPTHSTGVTNMTFSTLSRNIGTSYWSTAGNTLNSSYASGTCSNVYCHGEAFWTSVRGTGSQPSWTSSAYLTPYVKNDANCDKCHYTPPVASTRYNHSSMTIASACAGCHNHEGSGATHIDGNLYGAGDCNICHDYDTRANVTWGTGYSAGSGLVANSTTWGAHKKHIDHVKTLWGSVLDAANDTYGSNNYNAVCGVCHSRDTNNHMNTNRQVNFGDNVWGSMNQFGTSLPFWNTTAGSRSCSNLDCHYKATPQW